MQLLTDSENLPVVIKISAAIIWFIISVPLSLAMKTEGKIRQNVRVIDFLNVISWVIICDFHEVLYFLGYRKKVYWIHGFTELVHS